MRILAVTNMLPSADRPSKGTFVEQQVKGLRDAGVDVEVLLIDRVGFGQLAYVKTVGVVRSRVMQVRPDLVHIMYGGVMAFLATRATRLCPSVVSYCGTDLLGARHGPVAFRLRRAAGVLASHEAARRADGIVVKSEGLRLALPKGIDSSCVRIIPNGIDLGRFRPLDRSECRRKLGWEPDVFHVLFPTSDSGLRVKRLPLAEAAVALLNRMGVCSQMHGLPGVPHDEVPIWLNAADVLLLTSSHEGSPNIVKEALGCNRPVVSVDVGDVRERIQGIDGCYLAEPTPSDLAAKLAKVHDGPGVVNGRANVRDLTLEEVTMRLLELYDSVLTRWRQESEA
jgi:teichuronic acid biosynthesis glycosyltransferase TuaC